MSIIDKLLDFLESQFEYEKRYPMAKATRTCIRCGKEATEFRDAFGRLEYASSALCQDCQDEFYNHSP